MQCFMFTFFLTLSSLISLSASEIILILVLCNLFFHLAFVDPIPQTLENIWFSSMYCTLLAQLVF